MCPGEIGWKVKALQAGIGKLLVGREEEREAVRGILVKRLAHLYYKSCAAYHYPDAAARAREWSNHDGRPLMELFTIIAARLPLRARLTFVKTVCNSWHTSTRDGMVPRKCLMGCQAREAEDTLIHYLNCPLYIEMNNGQFK